MSEAAASIRRYRPQDWPDVARIYAAGIATGDATFETEVPGREAWEAVHPPAHRLVALAGGAVVGWAAVAPVSPRAVYRGVVESSVYVDGAMRRRGNGRALLEALVASTEAAGIWTLQAAIFPENEPSLRLHERVGFEVVGVRRRLAQRDGVWRDVLLLERRSPGRLRRTSGAAARVEEACGRRSRPCSSSPRSSLRRPRPAPRRRRAAPSCSAQGVPSGRSASGSAAA